MRTSANPLRIIFAGTPEFAAASLDALIARHYQVVAVYTQPDRPAGRGRDLNSSPVKQLALQHEITVVQPENLRTQEAQEALALFKPDLLIVAAYGLILPEQVLSIPRHGCINVHASLLPRWRGAAPIQRAILAGDRTTGITIMQMDAGLDTGKMLLQSECEISADETGGTLHDKLAQLGAACLLQSLDRLDTLQARAQVQNDALANYAKKLSKDEALIDWSRDATVIERQIRAFNPWPVAFSRLDEQRIRIWRAQVVKHSGSDPAGTIIKTPNMKVPNIKVPNIKAPSIEASAIEPSSIETSRESVLIACGKDALRLQEIQLPGGRRLDAAEVLKSKQELFRPGTLLQ